MTVADVLGYFVLHVFMCAMCMLGVLSGRGGCQMPQHWSYRQLGTFAWNLGKEPCPLQEKQEFLAAEPSLHPCISSLVIFVF